MSQKATIHDDGTITLEGAQIGTWKAGAGGHHNQTLYTVIRGIHRSGIDKIRAGDGRFVLRMDWQGPWRVKSRRYKTDELAMAALATGLADCWQHLIRDEENRAHRLDTEAKTKAAAEAGDASCSALNPLGASRPGTLSLSITLPTLGGTGRTNSWHGVTAASIRMLGVKLLALADELVAKGETPTN